MESNPHAATDQNILITEGTSFLGKALAKRLLVDNPKQIYIFSRDETKQKEMQEEFREATGSNTSWETYATNNVSKRRQKESTCCTTSLR